MAKTTPNNLHQPPQRISKHNHKGKYSQEKFNSSKRNNNHIHNMGKSAVCPGQLRTWKRLTLAAIHTLSLCMDEILHQTSIIEKTTTFTGKEDRNNPKSACAERRQLRICKSAEERSTWVKPGSPACENEQQFPT